MLLRRTLSTLSLFAVLAATVLVVAVGTSPAGAASMPTCPGGYLPTDVQCNQYATAGPLGGISVIGDSVMLGSADGLSNPGLPRLLHDAGWGPVNYLAGKGFTTGRNIGANRPMAAAYWIAQWRAQGWDPSTIVVHLGNNDNAFCPATVACMKQTIDYMLDVIGPQVAVWWPKLTTVDFPRMAAWNQALDLAAAERPNLRLWDWPGVLAAANPPFQMDRYNIHPSSSVQYVRRSRLMAADITTQFGPSQHVGADVAAPPALGTPTAFLPQSLQRVATNVHIDTQSSYTLDISALRPPSGASAVALTLESANPAADGFLTAYACDGDRPWASNLNFVAGQQRAAQALVPLSASGTVCIFTYFNITVNVDVQGWFVLPGTTGSTRFSPIAPDRRLDTRTTGRNQVNTLDFDPGVTAVALSMVGLDSTEFGSLTAWPCDQPQPTGGAAQIYFGPNEIIAGAAFVPVSADHHQVCVSTTVAADVVVDLTGTFSIDPGGDIDPGRLLYVPATVTRMLDTRDGTGGWLGALSASQTLDVRSAPTGALAVSGTLTMVQPVISGWVKATPCTGPQTSSSVNAPAGAILANSLTVGLTSLQRLCLTAYRNTNVLFDVSGWWVQ
ncbi:MAG: hypothetical protein ABIQ39_04580 [Ilumatobacteraceae bacterium]